MSSVKSDGSQTATLTTEHTLATVTDAGSYVLAVDTANMALGDILELRIYVKVRSGGTSRQLYTFTLAHVQTDGAFLSPPVPAPIEFKATLKQLVGTGRAYPWAVYAL